MDVGCGDVVDRIVLHTHTVSMFIVVPALLPGRIQIGRIRLECSALRAHRSKCTHNSKSQDERSDGRTDVGVVGDDGDDFAAVGNGNDFVAER